MNDFADDPLPGSFGDLPPNNIDNDISHLAADLIDAPEESQPMAPMRPQLSPEEEERRKFLIRKAKQIRSSQNAKIKLDQDMMMKLDSSNLQFLSNEEIEEVIKDAKWEIATHHSASAVNMAFTGGAMMLEKALVYATPIKATGFSNAVNPMGNVEIALLLEEMSFDIEPKFVPPHMRLMWAVANTLYVVHDINEDREAKLAAKMQAEKASKEANDAIDKL